MSGEKTRVLVVDDEPHVREAVRRVLEREGYEVTTAADGETALCLVCEQRPDIVVLDIIMPGIRGREVCRKIREGPADPRIIYFSGVRPPADDEDLERLRQEADSYLPKPATIKEIVSSVHAVLEAG